MKILITGSNGFIGKNLVSQLKNIMTNKISHNVLSNIELLLVDVDTSDEQLDDFTKKCDVVVNLAGINRPLDEKEFMEGNCFFIEKLLSNLKKYNNTAPIITTSSIQAVLDNPYGQSKKAGEEILSDYGNSNNVDILIYRLPNVFGKWCRPNYNSVVATFCNNIANDIEISINDESTKLELVYVDDVVEQIINAISGNVKSTDIFYSIPRVFSVTLGEIANLLYSFKNSRKNLSIIDMSDAFTKSLYSTYLSYLPTNEFSYPLKMNIDDRGSFTEILKSNAFGQISVNITKPGITKGNHWHHTKNEKFLVVSGEGIIQFRNIFNNEVISYNVSANKMEVVDIPTGYTHNIKNSSNIDLVTIMWCNESFDPNNPDTYFEEV